MILSCGWWLRTEIPWSLVDLPIILLAYWRFPETMDPFSSLASPWKWPITNLDRHKSATSTSLMTKAGGCWGGHGEGKYPKSWLAWTRMFFRQVETACQNLVGSTAGPTTDPELLISWSRFWPSNQRGILDSDSDSWFLTRIAGIVNHDRLLL